MFSQANRLPSTLIASALLAFLGSCGGHRTNSQQSAPDQSSAAAPPGSESGSSASRPIHVEDLSKMSSEELYRRAFPEANNGRPENSADEAQGRSQTASAVLADLTADPTVLPQLPKEFANPRVEPQPLDERDTAAGMIGKIVVVLDGRWKQQKLGYRIYRDAPAAQRAYDDFSYATQPELHIVSIERMNLHPAADSDARRYYTDIRCEAATSADMPALIGVRCVAIPFDRPVLVTAFALRDKSELTGVSQFMKLSPGGLAMVSSQLPDMIDAAMRRLHSGQ
jgi:hypothetical protein